METMESYRAFRASVCFWSSHRSFFLHICPECELKVIDQMSSGLGQTGHCAFSRLNWHCSFGSAPSWMRWRNSTSGLSLTTALCSSCSTHSEESCNTQEQVNVWFSRKLKYKFIILYWWYITDPGLVRLQRFLKVDNDEKLWLLNSYKWGFKLGPMNLCTSQIKNNKSVL